MDIQPLRQWLGNATTLLGFYQQRAQQLRVLNAIWQEQIEPRLRLHSQVANFREGRLVIAVDSPVWVSQLRFLVPALQQRLAKRSELAGLQTIQWYVRPTSAAVRRWPVRLPRPISEASRRWLQAAADGVQHRTLQDSLRRLAALRDEHRSPESEN